MLGFDGGGSLVDGFEFDVAESVDVMLGSKCFKAEILIQRRNGVAYPLLSPRASVAIMTLLISPNCANSLLKSESATSKSKFPT